MDESDQHRMERLLERVDAGDRDAFDLTIPLVYDELRRLADRQRRRWDGNETMNTTALVHEAYLRLVGHAGRWENRAHFLAVAATAMRQVLLDYARRARREKRGGGRTAVTLEDVEAALTGGENPAAARSEVLLALDAALHRLERHDPRQSRIIECRFYGGMTIPETAEALDISPATVKRGWAMAQAWLYREIRRDLEPGS